ncbi:MAG TPA: Spy/CpxP family protein refolding chaperone [Thermoanaerobaculia bacterium]|nr:Spy/CpxP family protein refolding chaperone [Thermoanaerobaculia bacterium]
MKRQIWAPAALLLLPSLAWAETAPQPYAGQETRQIKALSEEDIAALLHGRGMGLAKAAELNSYPGPMHVLELAASLQLTAEQQAATRKSFDRMQAEAVRLGQGIVARETELDRLFADGKAEPETVRAKVAEIAALQGELRAAHLAAHLEMNKVLTAEQVARYDQLRGYGTGAPAPHQHHHGHPHPGE